MPLEASQILISNFSFRTYQKESVHQYPEGVSEIIKLEALTLLAATAYTFDLSLTSQDLTPLILTAFFQGGTPSGTIVLEVLDATTLFVNAKYTVDLTTETYGEMSVVKLPFMIFYTNCTVRITPSTPITRLNIYAKKVVLEEIINASM